MTMHTVCRADELAIGQMKAVAVGSEKLVIYHLSDGFFATQANCRNGEVSKWANFPPGIQLLNIVRGEKALRTYPVTIDAGNVAVNLPAA